MARRIAAVIPKLQGRERAYHRPSGRVGLLATWDREGIGLVRASSWVVPAGEFEVKQAQLLPARANLPDKQDEVAYNNPTEGFFGYPLPGAFTGRDVLDLHRLEIQPRVQFAGDPTGLDRASRLRRAVVGGEGANVGGGVLQLLADAKDVHYIRRSREETDVSPPPTPVNMPAALVSEALSNLRAGGWRLITSSEPPPQQWPDGRGPYAPMAWGGDVIYGVTGVWPYDSQMRDLFCGVPQNMQGWLRLNLACRAGGVAGTTRFNPEGFPGIFYLDILHKRVVAQAPEWKFWNAGLRERQQETAAVARSTALLQREMLKMVLPLTEELLVERLRELEGQPAAAATTPSPKLAAKVKELKVFTMARSPHSQQLEIANNYKQAAEKIEKELAALGGAEEYPESRSLEEILASQEKVLASVAENWGVVEVGPLTWQSTPNRYVFFDTKYLTAKLPWTGVLLERESKKQLLTPEIELGRYRICFNYQKGDWPAEGAIIVRPPGVENIGPATTNAADAAGYIHPHINGVPCLGHLGVGNLEPKQYIQHLLRMQRFADVVTYMVLYLQSPNPENPYVAPEQWPVTDAFIEKAMGMVRDGWSVMDGGRFLKKGGVDYLKQYKEGLTEKKEPKAGVEGVVAEATDAINDAIRSVNASFRFTIDNR